MRKVSDILKSEREKKGLSLSYIERMTKIKKEYLLAIEEGKFSVLPSQSYALGFVKNYAEFLGLSRNNITALFRREYQDDSWEILPEFKKSTLRFKKGSLINSKNILGIILFLILGSYIFFQYKSLIFGPPLLVTNPKNGEIINDNVIEVLGKTEPYATILVNGEEVSVNTNGSFKKSVYVFSGEKKIDVVAKNRFGKERKITVDIMVK